MLRIGVDLGGTKIEVIALDEAGNTLIRRRIATPQNSYAGTLAAIVSLIASAERELGQQASVGIGIPGAESLSTDLIKNANSTCLIGKPLRHDLQALLQREVRFANDANCFALSEAVEGAGQGSELVFGVILGTGVGGGIVVRQQIISGANRIAGEWGHNPLPFLQEEDHPPPGCYCGRFGCIESWISGPGLADDHWRNTGNALRPEKIAALSASGDPFCAATLARYERRLAKSLALVINILDPEVIVLGGGLSNLDRLYRNVPLLWQQYVFSDSVTTRLVQNQYGDSSGVRGAAWLW